MKVFRQRIFEEGSVYMSTNKIAASALALMVGVSLSACDPTASMQTAPPFGIAVSVNLESATSGTLQIDIPEANMVPLMKNIRLGEGVKLSAPEGWQAPRKEDGSLADGVELDADNNPVFKAGYIKDEKTMKSVSDQDFAKLCSALPTSWTPKEKTGINAFKVSKKQYESLDGKISETRICSSGELTLSEAQVKQFMVKRGDNSTERSDNVVVSPAVILEQVLSYPLNLTEQAAAAKAELEKQAEEKRAAEEQARLEKKAAEQGKTVEQVKQEEAAEEQPTATPEENTGEDSNEEIEVNSPSDPSPVDGTDKGEDEKGADGKTGSEDEDTPDVGDLAIDSKVKQLVENRFYVTEAPEENSVKLILSFEGNSGLRAAISKPTDSDPQNVADYLVSQPSSRERDLEDKKRDEAKKSEGEDPFSKKAQILGKEMQVGTWGGYSGDEKKFRLGKNSYVINVSMLPATQPGEVDPAFPDRSFLLSKLLISTDFNLDAKDTAAKASTVKPGGLPQQKGLSMEALLAIGVLMIAAIGFAAVLYTWSKKRKQEQAEVEEQQAVLAGNLLAALNAMGQQSQEGQPYQDSQNMWGTQQPQGFWDSHDSWNEPQQMPKKRQRDPDRFNNDSIW